jgi:hypothetical protein
MIKYFIFAFILAAFLLLAPSATTMADPASSTVQQTQNPVPLETQLAATLPLWTKPGRLLLYVQRRIRQHSFAAVTLPPIDMSTIDLSTPEGVAAANRHTSVWFGSVLSIAPAEMTILNTDPALYDIPANEIAKAKPLEFLLKSLTTEQFGLLATAGLGITDLSPQQVPLFTAVIPDPLDLVSTDADPSDYESYKKQIVNIPRDQILQQIRLHFYLDENIHIKSDNFDNVYFNGYFREYSGGTEDNTPQNYFSTGPMKYAGDIEHTQDQGGQEGALLDSLLVQQVPSALKKSDFNWKERALNQPISIDNISTVNDLVAQLSKVLNKELYADTLYGRDNVTLGGDLKTPVSASDLMQALAFSLNAAWRHVGPCYILTDDIAGLGQRQEEVKDIVSSWSNQLREYGSTAKKLAGFNWLTSLSAFPNKTDLLPSDQLMTILDGGTKQDTTIKWSELPAGIQTGFAKQIDEQNRRVDDYNEKNTDNYHKIVITPDTPVDVSAEIMTALELPGDGIMSYGSIIGELTPPIEDDSKITLSGKSQAVICAPKSTREAIQTVDKLSKMGLNTLIIDVFCNGKSYFDNSALPPKSKDSGNVLSAAITEAAKKNITVYAAVDLLCWRKDYAQKYKTPWPFSIPEDVDIFGRPSEVDGVERRKKGALDEQYMDDSALDGTVDEQINDSWVSPFDPTVRTLLSSLMAELANVQGISGIIMLNTASPGYVTNSSIIDSRPALGFSLVNRLKFIREKHLDPIDTNAALVTAIQTDGNVYFENFPSFISVISGFERPINNPFQAYLDGGNLEILNQCSESARKANPSISILAADRTLGIAISPWKDTKASADTTAGSPSSLAGYSFLSIPILLMGSNGSSVVQDVQHLETTDDIDFYTNTIPHGAKPDGIAYNLVDGGVNQNVPDMLNWLATYLAGK